MLISCDTCEEVDCPPPFTNEDLLWLPYSVGDKLVFLEKNSSDSLIYSIRSKKRERNEPTELGAPYCITACYYHISVLGDRKFSNGEEERIGFGMDKTIREFRLGSNARTNSESEFKLSDAIHLDSLVVNGTYIKDVYKYACKPEQEKVAETYMHQGLGLVKIILRDGQEYELVEHI